MLCNFRCQDTDLAPNTSRRDFLGLSALAMAATLELARDGLRPMRTIRPGQLAKFALLAAVIALLYFGRVFFVTVMIAVIIAFLLDPLVGLVMKLKLPRAFASFVVCSVALLVLYLVGLAVYTECANLVEDLPLYSQRMNALADNIGSRVDEMEKKTYELIVPKRFQEQPQLPAGDPQIAIRVRPACPIRLGGVFLRGLGDGPDAQEDSASNGTPLSEGNRDWVTANCDVAAFDAGRGRSVEATHQAHFLAVLTVRPAQGRCHVNDPSDQFKLRVIGIRQVSAVEFGLLHAVAVIKR